MSRLEEWIEERLEVVGRSGKEIICICPWCGGAKLYINIQKRKFICYRGCSAGKTVTLISKVDGVSVDRAEEQLQQRGIKGDDLLDALDRVGSDYVSPELLTTIPLPEEFVPCFDGTYWRVPIYASAVRELDDATLLRHGIGYAKRGRYHNRLILPIHFRGHRTFQARLMGEPADFTWKNDEGKVITPSKYLYPTDSDISRLLYWGDHVRTRADLVIVEGAFDAIRLIGLGFQAVATFGKRVSVRQAVELRKLSPRAITIMYDKDAAAEAAVEAAALAEIAPAYFVTPDDDPDTLGLEGREAVEKVLDSRVLASKLGALEHALDSLL